MVAAAAQSELCPLSLEILRLTSTLLLEDRDPDTLCQELFELLEARTAVDIYFHYLVAPDGKRLEMASCGGNARAREYLGTPLEFGEAVCGRVAQTCTPMMIETLNSRDDEMTKIVRGAGALCYVCFPLMAQEQMLGTLSFGSTTMERFDEEELKLLGVIAQQVALATARRKEAEYLRGVEQMATAGRMSAILAHEINNPLDSLLSVMHMLGDEVQSEHGHELLSLAGAQVERLVETARRTLETFRGAAAVTRAVNLSDLACQLASDIKLPRDAKLTVQVEPGVCVQVVAGELRQVLFNLMLNAAQFSPMGGRVTLSVRNVEGFAEVRVRDEGVGISAKGQEDLFKPFRTTRASGGTGIGLWLSHELVERNGGTMRVESDPAQRPGTEFVARFPAIQ